MKLMQRSPKGTVVVRFDKVSREEFAAILAAIKAIPGRTWSKEHKFWYWKHPDPVKLRAFAAFFKFTISDACQGWMNAAAYETWNRQRLKDESTEQTITIPKVVHKPWGHQLRAYQYLCESKATLLDMGMGTGKSRVIVDYIVNHGMYYTLIICPKSVIPVWPYQFQQHAAEIIDVYPLTTGSTEAKGQTITTLYKSNPPPYAKNVFVINYESAWRMATWLLKLNWDMVVLDESHKIKAPGGKASRFMARLRDRAKKRVCLTGTPMPHGPLDLYGQYRFLDPSIYGTNFHRDVKQQYAIMGGFNDYQIVGYKNQDEFAEKMNRIRFHASRDVLDLPEVVSNTIPIYLDEKNAKLYNEIEQDFYAKVESGEVVASNALVKILRLQQITSGHIKDENEVVHTLHDAKQKALQELLEDIPSDEPVVVFARFRHDLHQITTATWDAGREYRELSGKHKQLDVWSHEEGGQVLGVQIGAGAEGVDLTRAHYAVYYSFTHNMGQWEQAHARVHRPGQTKTTFNYYLTVERSIDTKILNALQEKKNIVEYVLGLK